MRKRSNFQFKINFPKFLKNVSIESFGNDAMYSATLLGGYLGASLITSIHIAKGIVNKIATIKFNFFILSFVFFLSIKIIKQVRCQ